MKRLIELMEEAAQLNADSAHIDQNIQLPPQVHFLAAPVLRAWNRGRGALVAELWTESGCQLVSAVKAKIRLLRYDDIRALGAEMYSDPGLRAMADSVIAEAEKRTGPDAEALPLRTFYEEGSDDIRFSPQLRVRGEQDGTDTFLFRYDSGQLWTELKLANGNEHNYGLLMTMLAGGFVDTYPGCVRIARGRPDGRGGFAGTPGEASRRSVAIRLDGPEARRRLAELLSRRYAGLVARRPAGPEWTLDTWDLAELDDGNVFIGPDPDVERERKRIYMVSWGRYKNGNWKHVENYFAGTEPYTTIPRLKIHVWNPGVPEEKREELLSNIEKWKFMEVL